MSAMKKFENIEIETDEDIESDPKTESHPNTDSEIDEKDIILQRHDDELKYEEYEEEI